MAIIGVLTRTTSHISAPQVFGKRPRISQGRSNGSTAAIPPENIPVLRVRNEGWERGSKGVRCAVFLAREVGQVLGG